MQPTGDTCRAPCSGDHGGIVLLDPTGHLHTDNSKTRRCSRPTYSIETARQKHMDVVQMKEQDKTAKS